MTFTNQHREFLRGSCTTGRTTSLTLVGIEVPHVNRRGFSYLLPFRR